jgi:hypothetical protein
MILGPALQRGVNRAFGVQNSSCPASGDAGSRPRLIQKYDPFPAGRIGCLDHLVLNAFVNHASQRNHGVKVAIGLPLSMNLMLATGTWPRLGTPKLKAGAHHHAMGEIDPHPFEMGCKSFETS